MKRPEERAALGPSREEARSSDIEVSVVIPCLDEAETIAACIVEAEQALIASEASGEVVVVDNGSIDGSEHLAATAGARVIYEPRRGYGTACRAGFEAARGRFVVMGDGDGTYNFGQIRLILPGLRKGADLVTGTRLRGEMEEGAMPWLHRYIGNPLLTWLLASLFRVKVSDILCGLRGFKAELPTLLGLEADGMELCPEMIILAAKHGLEVEEVPVDYRCRRGQSKLRTFRDGWINLRLLIKHARHRRQVINRELPATRRAT
jgi:glycosyltransferase involved in cell wall biosynthesis